jgi:hypothetical protein
LVVVDPGPDTAHEEPGQGRWHHHESPASAEGRLRAAGFEVLRRQDAFIAGAGQERWWLIVARRPADRSTP